MYSLTENCLTPKVTVEHDFCLFLPLTHATPSKFNRMENSWQILHVPFHIIISLVPSPPPVFPRGFAAWEGVQGMGGGDCPEVVVTGE